MLNHRTKSDRGIYDSSAVSRLKALVFDIFGTVVDWRSSLITELSAFGQRRGILADWPLLVDEWRAAYYPSMDRVRNSEQTWTTLDALHRQSLERLVASLGIGGLKPEDLDELTDAWRRLRPWPDVKEGMQRLATRYILGPLSNANFALMVRLRKFAGLPWDSFSALTCGSITSRIRNHIRVPAVCSTCAQTKSCWWQPITTICGRLASRVYAPPLFQELPSMDRARRRTWQRKNPGPWLRQISEILRPCFRLSPQESRISRSDELIALHGLVLEALEGQRVCLWRSDPPSTPSRVGHYNAHANSSCRDVVLSGKRRSVISFLGTLSPPSLAPWQNCRRSYPRRTWPPRRLTPVRRPRAQLRHGHN
jgi:2-haloalkanoic acid dehalogenase type II